MDASRSKLLIPALETKHFEKWTNLKEGMDATNRSFSNKESFFRGYILTPYWKINYFVSEHAKHHEKVMCLSPRPLKKIVVLAAYLNQFHLSF